MAAGGKAMEEIKKRKPESSQISQHPREFARSKFKTLPQLKEKNYFKLQSPPNLLSYLSELSLSNTHMQSQQGLWLQKKMYYKPHSQGKEYGAGLTRAAPLQKHLWRS